LLNAVMYCWATCTLGDQPHQVRFAEVAEPEPPDGEPPPLAQAAVRTVRQLAIRTAAIDRRRRLLVGDFIVPPGPGQAAGGYRRRRTVPGHAIGPSRLAPARASSDTPMKIRRKLSVTTGGLGEE
jgi:hypothetical protein